MNGNSPGSKGVVSMRTLVITYPKLGSKYKCDLSKVPPTRHADGIPIILKLISQTFTSPLYQRRSATRRLFTSFRFTRRCQSSGHGSNASARASSIILLGRVTISSISRRLAGEDGSRFGILTADELSVCRPCSGPTGRDAILPSLFKGCYDTLSCWPIDTDMSYRVDKLTGCTG